MWTWLIACAFLALSPPLADAGSRALAQGSDDEPGKGEKPETDPKPGPGDEGKGAPPPAPPTSKGAAKDGAAKDAKDTAKPQPSPAPARPTPKLKTSQATEKLEEGLRKLEARDYAGARSIFSASLKDAATPADRKTLQGLIDDTKLGSELETARAMAGRKQERKAIAQVEKALKQYPESTLRPAAERFIQETEEIVYLILDDFEPGEGLQEAEKKRADGKTEIDDPAVPSALASTRWRKNMSFNSDPRFVKHGKGSMKWRVGGDYYLGSYYRYWYNGFGYNSAELKNPITKWRHLVFNLFLPEADEGSLRVTLSPELDMGVVRSLYTKKFFDLRGKRGWVEVRLDLKTDFGNTANVNLEDIRYVRIDYLHFNQRTLYMDFVHFE